MLLTIRNLVINIVNVVFGVIGLLLLLRILFNLLAANPQTPIVAWLYNLTNQLLYPFSGIVPNLALGSSGGVLDTVAVIALLVYLILGYILISIIRSLTNFLVERYYTRSSVSHYHDIDRP